MKLLKALLAVLCLSFATVLPAQDIHFSMFNMSPLTLNPANTGAFAGTFRVGGIYRSQWGSFITPYQTPSAYIDAPVIYGFRDQDWVGVGAMLYQDDAGIGGLSTGSYQLSVAYHLGLDKKGMSTLTLGVQGGMMQGRLKDPNSLRFQDQIENGVATSEDLTNLSFDEKGRISGQAEFDLSAGLRFSQVLGDKGGFNIGVGVMHILTPNTSILSPASMSNENGLPIRLNVHGELRHDLGEKWLIHPSALYSTIGPANEINVQALVGRYFGENRDIALKLGPGYRFGDAVEVILGIDYKQFRAGVSYDLNVSELQEVSNLRGGFEIGVSYIAQIYKDPEVTPIIFCPQL